MLREIVRLLPEPVRQEAGIDGSITLVGGDPSEVVVRVRHEEVLVSLYGVRWDGPYTPVVTPQELAGLRWDRLPSSSLLVALHGLIRTASGMRKSTFVECEFCKRVCPSESTDGGTDCHGCRERVLGIVH